MLINFNDLFLLSIKVNGIIHIGAHNLEELPDYLKGNVRRIIWLICIQEVIIHQDD